MSSYDCVILGAGAAGVYCGTRTAGRGRRTLVLEQNTGPTEKIRSWGKERLVFSHKGTQADSFAGGDPKFVRSALRRFKPAEICKKLSTHNLDWQQDSTGELVLQGETTAFLRMMLDEFEASGADLKTRTVVAGVKREGQDFWVSTSTGVVTCKKLIIATGGIAAPQTGVSDIAFDLAQQFGHRVSAPRPGLAPFLFEGRARTDLANLAGISLPVKVQLDSNQVFDGTIAFDEYGIRGSAMLNASLFWKSGTPLTVDLNPKGDALEKLVALRDAYPVRPLGIALSSLFPSRFATLLANAFSSVQRQPLGQLSEEDLARVVHRLRTWKLKPSGLGDWKTAMVTAGGVATEDINPRTMESRKQSGLFFIGECLDVTGTSGGHNMHWAWASAAAAGDKA